jgi:ribosomal protein S18 acetylase RimI-like enzyme
MTSPQQLEVLDLRHFNAKQLRPLLEQEAEFWNQRLRWDYRSSTELLLQFLDSRILPGFVAIEGGQILGFCFCVYEGTKGVIGDVYANRALRDPLAIVSLLLRHLLETLQASPDIHRIEGQLLLFDEGVLPPIIRDCLSANAHFTLYPRNFLECDLTQPRSNAPDHSTQLFPPDLELARWSPNFYNPSAELIRVAYANHLDSSINDQYRTSAGCQRFLHNIIRFPGCGTFDPDSSFVLRTRRGNNLIAMLLISRVAPDTGHLTQLCVAPPQRGRRLGAALLTHVLRHLPTRNYRYLTLTVSEQNFPALNLYYANNFHTRYRFDALVIEKPTKSFFRPILPFRQHP